ncbi:MULTISPECIES: anti-sigma factor antagonist [unclassified Nostoc]|uniref:anti-sigma factor antagonist n=1 Tax=unclassified Nostoc TaxID=2593658 RepID=UPI002AD350C7|nr:anti-sigma factor antagonist [Nostoc sp. DedQUE03]MDZ7973654.1 anti-sigma factor antagonist [Nostoc sp. DedQUE03]MDZ8049827.1 anti-sigma factor antagonist [Nostoc sp. DedQUE02]
MTFNATLQINNDIAKIKLSGELDAMTAPIFKTEVDKAASSGVKYLILLMQNLEYMSSAGLRVLIFAKQKMGVNVDIYVVGAQEMVISTLKKTGFDQSVILVDEDKTIELESA